MNAHERHIAAQLYQTALARGASPVAARYLVGAAYAESGFNPMKTGSDHGTSAGMMQTGVRLFNRMIGRGQTNPVSQMNAYIDALQQNAPQTWTAMNSAPTIHGVYSAQYANPDWRMGALTGQRAPIYASQFSPFNNLPIPELHPPTAQQQSPAPTATPAPIPVPQGLGQLSQPPEIPNVPPMEPAMSMQELTPEQMARIQSQPGPSFSQPERPGFADLSAQSPTGNFSNPENIGTYNPETGFSFGTPPSISGDFADYQFSLPGITQPGLSSDYMFGVGSPADNSQSYVSANGQANVGVGDLSGGISGQREASVGDNSTANVASNDIQNFGGDMSLGADVPSSDTAFLGVPGSRTIDPAINDFYAANNQFGENGWYYDANGNAVPIQSQSASPQSTSPADTASTSNDSDLSADFGGSAPPPDSLPSGMSPGQETGVFAAAGPFSTSGVGPQFSYYGNASTYGGDLNPQAGMFGLGAMNAAGGGVSMTGAGYGDQMSRLSSGADQGFGDKGAVQDFLDTKEANHLANDPAWMPHAGKAPATFNGRYTNLNWGGNSGGHAGHIAAAVPSPWTTPTTVPQPPQGAHKGAVVMPRKSGEVPGVDHGYDEVAAMLQPGEIVLNKGQMAGLSIKNPRLLRRDQIKAIKQQQSRRKQAA